MVNDRSVWRWVRRERSSGVDEHRKRLIALHEAGEHPLRFGEHFEIEISFEDFFPDDLELHFGQAIADAAMDAEAERQMAARILAVDDELVRVGNGVLVAVARDVPHHDLFALLDLLTLELDIGRRGAAHMGERGL